MKLIAFLGTTNYSLTTFVWEQQEQSTQFFPVAAAHFLKPERVLICATPTVQAHKNLGELTRQLDTAGIAWQVVPIPEGHSEADLWKIFDVLTDSVQKNESVVFDVTHSFRSLPFLAFLAVAYLQVAKQVKVEKVLYGAWEARDQSTNRSPVFDLTPFVRLLDWLTATDQFTQTGDARRLAGLLSTGGKGAAAQASQKLSQVSLAAFLCQPFTLMREASTLDSALQQAESELAQSAPPFGVLREQITGVFASFGADEKDVPAMLRAQFRLIEWYFKNNQLIQAMTLSREWLISTVTWRLGQPILLKREARESIEFAITDVAAIGGPRVNELGEAYTFSVEHLKENGLALYNMEERAEIIKTWSTLADVRNRLNHAGHKLGTVTPEDMLKTARNKIMPRLRALAEKWGLV